MLQVYDQQEFVIKSGTLNELDSLCQSIALLLQTESPFQDTNYSFNDLIGYSDINSIKAEVPIRVKNLETKLKAQYELTSIRVYSIVEDGEDGVDILLDVVTPYATKRITVTV